MSTIPGAPSVLGSPKGGEDKPTPRSQVYPMKRCCECTLLRALDWGGMCAECRTNLNNASAP